MTATRLPAVLALLAALALGGCGEIPTVPLPGLDSGYRQPGSKQACFIADVSGSQLGYRLDGTFSRLIYATAIDVGHNGSGRLCVAFAAGPQVRDGLIHDAAVTPEHPENARRARAEVTAKVAQATKSLLGALADPPEHASGSWLFNAVNEVARARDFKPGDEVVFISDMREDSDYVRVNHGDTTDAGVSRLIERLRGEGRLPNLRGVVLRAPYINQVARLDPATGKVTYESSMEGGRPARVVQLWEAYAEATGATFTQNQPALPADTPPWVKARG